MSIYAIKKNASGTVLGLVSYGNAKTPLPEGFVSCSSEEYATAKISFMNNPKDQATTRLLQVQQEAALAVAMGASFGPKMKSYVSRLREISLGKDTSGISLPEAPEDYTQ